MDTEKRIHKSYQLFQVWLSKSYFVVEAIKINPFQSQVFVWSDIGCFRSQPRYNQLVIHPEIVPEASILLMAAGPGSDWMNDLNTDFKPPTSPWILKTKTKVCRGYKECGWNLWIAGAQMAGRTKSWISFDKAFYETLAGYASRDMFFGDDQAVTQSVCLQHYQLCQIVRPKAVRGTPWFGLQDVLHRGG